MDSKVVGNDIRILLMSTSMITDSSGTNLLKDNHSKEMLEIRINEGASNN